MEEINAHGDDPGPAVKQLQTDRMSAEIKATKRGAELYIFEKWFLVAIYAHGVITVLAMEKGIGREPSCNGRDRSL